MAIRKFSKSHHGTMNELNITPLLDLAFVLLVIFIITTAPMVNDLDLNLPANQAAAPTNAVARPHLLIVEADGRLNFDGTIVPLTTLRTNLIGLQRQDAKTTVVLFSEDAAIYQHTINVLDVLQRAAITNVGLAPMRPSPASQL